jgi:cytidine deaminase
MEIRPENCTVGTVHQKPGETMSPKSSAEELLQAARQARLFAHAPFSGFQVGAALETSQGKIITGCNIENATFGLTLCAERVAMFKAISEGERTFHRIAIVADTAEPTPPCGACRQILWEFGGDLEIILGNLHQETTRYRLRELLPIPFDGRLLGFDEKMNPLQNET